jgi:serine/threonine protein phosphatase PrpC
MLAFTTREAVLRCGLFNRRRMRDANAEFRAVRTVSLSPFRVESAAITHQGCVREQNQDSHCDRARDGLWAVADGMGGHEGGEWASARVVEALERVDLPAGLAEAGDRVADAVRVANAAILAEAERRGRQMGTTMVALLVQDQRFLVLWVGDSRAYLLRDGAFAQLSRDHSQVQEMIDRGLMAPNHAIGHPMSHILSRAIGVREAIEVDRVEGEVRPGDVFLLCSDGLHGYVAQDEIRQRLGRGAPECALDELLDLTLAAGAPDNVTMIAVWASDPTMLSFTQPGTS